MRREKAEKFLDWVQKTNLNNETELNKLDAEIASITREILKTNPKSSKEEINDIEHELFVYTQNMMVNSGLGNKLKAYLEFAEETPFKEKIEKSLNAGRNAENRKIRAFYQLYSPLIVRYLMNDLSENKIKLPNQLGTEME